MIKSSVTISLVPSLAGGPWIYWDDLKTSISKAKRTGFHGIELFTASADAVENKLLSELFVNRDGKLFNNEQLSVTYDKIGGQKKIINLKKIHYL